jgi:hypothetical protein
VQSPTVPAVALVALLAVAGLSAAQGSGSGTEPPQGGGPGGSGGPHNQTAPEPSQGPPQGNASSPPPPQNCDQEPQGQARERCIKERYCANHPADPRCGSRPPQNGTANGTVRRGGPHGPPTVDRLQHIQFTVVAPRHIVDYKVDGQLTLDSLRLDTGSTGPPMTGRFGNMLVVGDENTRLRLFDNPVGLIELKSQDGSVLLGFPADTDIVATDQGARVHYADGRDGLLVADHASWSGRNVTLTGFFSFHIARSDGPFDQVVAGGDLRAKLQAAVATRRLGAEVALKAHPANASQAVQVLAYDDMTVQVQVPGGDAPIAVQLSANLTQGRTVVLHVDPALVGNATPDRIVLHYYDDHSDGTQSEVVFARAASLADVLDPTAHGGRPVYWVVQDADGLQVLVSVPHWSTHTVTLQGLAAVLQPSVLLGLVAGVAGTAVAAVAMFWPRRQR